jgi:hypothetical protein
MTTECFNNRASAGWTTYGASLADFHCFRAAQRDMNDSAYCGLRFAPQYYALHYSITSIIRGSFILSPAGEMRAASGSAKESAVYLRLSSNRSEQAKFKQGST